MFYIRIKDKYWNKPESTFNKVTPTSKPSEVEAINEKSSKLAKAKSTESIRNIQQVYYLERRLFS